MITTILVTLFVGLIVGACARLVMPGAQNISLLMTILLGALGSLAGSWISVNVMGSSGNSFALVPFLIGVVAAVVFIAVYLKVVAGRGSTRV